VARADHHGRGVPPATRKRSRSKRNRDVLVGYAVPVRSQGFRFHSKATTVTELGKEASHELPS